MFVYNTVNTVEHNGALGAGGERKESFCLFPYGDEDAVDTLKNTTLMKQ